MFSGLPAFWASGRACRSLVRSQARLKSTNSVTLGNGSSKLLPGTHHRRGFLEPCRMFPFLPQQWDYHRRWQKRESEQLSPRIKAFWFLSARSEEHTSELQSHHDLV